MLNRDMQKSLHMAVFGMDKKTFKTLEFAMQKMGKGLATFVNEHNSEAAIFNLDNPDTKSQLQKYQQTYPENPVMLLSVKVPDDDNGIFVKKPFDMDELLAAIRQIQQQKRDRLRSLINIKLPTLKDDSG